MEGILVVNKPSGITSHDVVDRVRRALKMRRVGHAGTLDPMATGVLIILVGPATKLFDQFVAFDKAYRATLQLGLKTHSADIQGNVIQERPFADITREQVEKVFRSLTGSIEQVPPMVSAVKVQGKRLYALARKGIEVKREARSIRVDCFDLKKFEPPYVEFYVECSKGTYIRQLAEDAGEILGCGACITQIERTKVGPFTIDQSVLLDDVKSSDLRPWEF